MNTNDQEIEAKFYIQNLAALEERLKKQGGVPVQPRVFERNLRFDTPDRSLSRDLRVLRLRQDTRARLTFKGPAAAGEAVSIRQEIEVEVADFDATRRLLEALGYEISVMYEKYRTSYDFQSCEVSLDEMPFGNFAEIEGPGTDAILAAATALGLDWSARASMSYLALFSNLKTRFGLTMPHLTFDAFQGRSFTAADFDLKPADR
ncbi:MAG TPA: class IV adenylate cyclase [Longilinea sp.]|nr:class IV adenylate cyclase [Longilinea sp.]